MNPEERETNINFDHHTKRVKIFTSQPSEYRHFVKRIGDENCEHGGTPEDGYTIEADQKHFRNPYMVARA